MSINEPKLRDVLLEIVGVVAADRDWYDELNTRIRGVFESSPTLSEVENDIIRNVVETYNVPQSLIITTPCGQEMDVMNQQAIDAHQPDAMAIARSLSQINRWNGRTSVPINVAAHSLNLSNEVGGTYELTLYALMHDAAEAYVGDIISPIKNACPDWLRDVEERILVRLYESVGLSLPDDDVRQHVHRTDKRAYEWELCETGTLAPVFWLKPGVVAHKWYDDVYECIERLKG